MASLESSLEAVAEELGMRMLMDVIPLDASLVKGSHGTLPDEQVNYPMMLSDPVFDGADRPLESTEIASLIEHSLSHECRSLFSQSLISHFRTSLFNPVIQ